jgi:hypothetical protein
MPPCNGIRYGRLPETGFQKVDGDKRMKGRLMLLPFAVAVLAWPVAYGQTSVPQMKPVAYKVVDGNKVDNDNYMGWKT